MGKWQSASPVQMRNFPFDRRKSIYPRPDEKIGKDMFSADGKVRDVVYLGLYTRYLVELNGGGDLVVVEQNLNTTSMDVMKARGQKVHLFWKKEHVRYLGGPECLIASRLSYIDVQGWCWVFCSYHH